MLPSRPSWHHAKFSLPIHRSNLAIKYLGISLSTRCLKIVNGQPLTVKVAFQLVLWHGKNIVAASRCTLIKYLVTSQASFHIIHLPCPTPVFCKPSTSWRDPSFGMARTSYCVPNARSIGKANVSQNKREGSRLLTVTSSLKHWDFDNLGTMERPV
jgi:hypothetical protein